VVEGPVGLLAQTAEDDPFEVSRQIGHELVRRIAARVHGTA
jgi:hypothetical protein